jgi:starch phosphorylase
MSSQRPNVGYFCMEYGLKTELKTYSGGLGILAGDFMKGVSDGDYPMVGIGLKWKQGYVTQTLGDEGQIIDAFPNADFPDLEDTGIKVTVTVGGKDVVVKAWKVPASAGVKDLYLLDTDLPENDGPVITDRLYGGDHIKRVQQEMILGIGGVRFLQAANIAVDLYHFNEGHAVLAGIELICQAMKNDGCGFEEALATVKRDTVFTTHTPVFAGNEQHNIDYMMDLGAHLDLTEAQMQRLGGTPFNMTVAALRMARSANGVAQLHGVTARNMWAHITDKCDIGAITNGIHHGTWVDDTLYKVRKDPDALWERHQALKGELIDLIAARQGVTLAKDKFLIGFARRATPYKRSNLIYQSGQALRDLLADGRYQLVFSGKAHPADTGGKEMIMDLVALAEAYPDRVVFIENYDMTIGAAMTRGADIWLNNPRRPLEACGTSGMKAAMNGVPNVSILDGWWPEACRHGINGWAIGDTQVPETVEEQDTRDAEFLSQVLIEDVIPTYYDNRSKWIEIMQASIEDTYEPFSVKTMLDNYYKDLY